MAETRLLKHELARITGINMRTILDWTQKGILVPVESNKGQGKLNYYDRANVVEAKILQLLSTRGMSIKRYSEILKGLSDSERRRLASQWVDAEYLIILEKTGKVVFVLGQDFDQKIFFDNDICTVINLFEIRSLFSQIYEHDTEFYSAVGSLCFANFPNGARDNLTFMNTLKNIYELKNISKALHALQKLSTSYPVIPGHNTAALYRFLEIDLSKLHKEKDTEKINIRINDLHEFIERISSHIE